jgi:hypothetical protein
MLKFNSKQPIEIIRNRKGDPILLGQALLVTWVSDPNASEEDQRRAAMEFEANARSIAHEKRATTLFFEVPPNYNGPGEVETVTVVRQKVTPSLATAAQGFVFDNTPAPKYLN